jgi:hypothetical protein
MSKAVQLYPHEMSTALELRLTDFDDPMTGCAVEVREASSLSEDGENDSAGRVQGYDAFSSGTPWRKLTFRLTADLPDAELGRVLPATSSVETDTTLVVLMTCPSTKFRHGVRLARSKHGAWTGHATIQRADIKGVVMLRPQLVRATGIPTTEDLPFATKTGAVIAVGEPISIYVDVEPSGVGVFHSTVVLSWEDFANSEHAWRREHPDDVFHLEPYGGEPRLYLNSRYTQLREILESDAKRGPEAVLRDMTAALIAQPALLQLATVALTGLESDDDSGTVVVPSGWRGDLVASVLPRLYPEEASEEERLRRAAHEIREADGAASLMARLGSVVQEMVASYKTVEAAIRTYESTREREEVLDD